MKKFLHLGIDVTVILLVSDIQLDIALGHHRSLKDGHRSPPRRFFLLNSGKNTVLIDIDGCNSLLLEELNHLSVQNSAALYENDFRLPFVNRTPDQHLRQQAPDSKRF